MTRGALPAVFSFPPKLILAALDGTPPSKAAWRRAAELKSLFGAATEAVTVVNASPGEEIPLLARERKADMIVVGTHARKGLERLLEGGSVAEAVVRRSPVPVWVEKENAGTPHSILVPLNFTDYSDRALEYATQVAVAFEAKITLMHVMRDKKDSSGVKKMLCRRLGRLSERLKSGRRAKMEIVLGDPGRAIAHRSQKHGLVVLSAHRKSFLEELTVGTTAERVIRHSPVATLAVPSQE